MNQTPPCIWNPVVGKELALQGENVYSNNVDIHTVTLLLYRRAVTLFGTVHVSPPVCCDSSFTIHILACMYDEFLTARITHPSMK